MFNIIIQLETGIQVIRSDTFPTEGDDGVLRIWRRGAVVATFRFWTRWDMHG